MRITIKLDAFDHAAKSAFAVLWLDRESGRWSREGHDRLDVPPWGTWKSTFAGTLLLDPLASNALLMLHGLRLNASSGTPAVGGPPGPAAREKMESQRGRADYFGCGANNEPRTLDAGHWHVQCVDRETTIAEHEVFSDEPDPFRDRRAHAGDPDSLAT